MLTESRRMLEQMRAGRPTAQDAPEVEGGGEAADGKVRVQVGPGGRVERIELDPRVMRMASHDLADALVHAVNSALDDLRAKAVAQGLETGVNTAALTEQVQRIQDDGLRQMELINQSIAEVMARFSTGRSR